MKRRAETENGNLQVDGTRAGGARAMIACSMCGHSFTPQEGAACRSGCPVAGGCGMVTCPSCGFEFPPESKLFALITRLVRRVAPSRGRAMDAETARG